MTRNVVTTELVADQPVVVVLHHDQKIVEQLQQAFSAEQLHTEFYSITELLQSPAIQQRLSDAYKIAWLTSTQEYIEFQPELVQTNQLLSNYQHKLSLFFSVITAFVEQVPGELPYAKQFLDFQQEAILFHNSYLPSATFLFGQDLVGTNISISFLSLVSQDLFQGKVYGLTTHLHPQSLESYFSRAVRYFLQPQRSSVLIRGNSVPGKVVAYEIKNLYQSYHFSMVDVQEIVAHTSATVPFSAKENFVTDDVTALITHYVQSLPTPSALPKQSVWQLLLGSLQPPTPEYGTEVETSYVAEDMTPQYDEIVSTPLPAEELQPVQLETVPVSAPSPSVTESFVAQSRIQQPIAQTDDTAVVSPPGPKEDFDLNQEIQNIFSTTHVTNKKNSRKEKSFQNQIKKTHRNFLWGPSFYWYGFRDCLFSSRVYVQRQHA